MSSFSPSTILSSSAQGISSLTKRINELNNYHLKLCVVKTVGTVIGTIGAVSLMSAPFATGGISTLICVAVGSVGTLTGVGVNLGADFVNKKLTAKVLEDVQEELEKGGEKVEKASRFWEPAQLLNLIGIADDMRVLSHSLKLLQVHALLVRMFQMNTKLLIKMAYYKTEGSLQNALKRWATSDYFSQSLKWTAVVATGVVVLIDMVLVINEWKNNMGDIWGRGKDEGVKDEGDAKTE